MNEYAIDRDILDRHGRVFRHTIKDRSVFVKKRDLEKKHIGHHLQGILYRFTGEPMLAPSVLSRNEDDVAYQVNKLRALRKAGIDVPEVLHVDADYFVMGETGEDLGNLLARQPHRATELLPKACAVMAGLHRKDFVHGGAQIKNFTVKGDTISLIDFEETYPPEHKEAFKTRDVLIFLLSLERAHFVSDVHALCAHYERLSGREVHHTLCAFLSKYAWVSFIEHPFFNFLRISDVREFVRFVQRFTEK